MAKDPQKVGERKAYGDRRRDDYTTKSNQRKLTRRIKKLNKATEKLDPGEAKEVRRRAGTSAINAGRMAADAKSAKNAAVSRGVEREDISAKKRGRLVKKVQKKEEKVQSLIRKSGPDPRREKGEGRKVKINVSLPKRKKRKDKPNNPTPPNKPLYRFGRKGRLFPRKRRIKNS